MSKKTTFTKTGWKTTTTTTQIFEVREITDKPYLYYGESWKRIRQAKDQVCRCCKRHYEDDEALYMVFTDKGNQHVCEECAAEIRSRHE